MELVDICKRVKIDIIASEIVSRGDDLNVKGKAVNQCLKEMCMSKNAWFLEHTNIIPGTHLITKQVISKPKRDNFFGQLFYKCS